MKDNQNGVCACTKRCSKKGSGTGENECLEISFMIFRTGSVLIVGHCNIPILHIVYGFLKTILMEDYADFRINMIKPLKKAEKKKKLREKNNYNGCKIQLIYLKGDISSNLFIDILLYNLSFNTNFTSRNSLSEYFRSFLIKISQILLYLIVSIS